MVNLLVNGFTYFTSLVLTFSEYFQCQDTDLDSIERPFLPLFF